MLPARLPKLLLLTLVGIGAALPVLRIFRDAAFFRQSGALGFLLRLWGVLIAYALVIFWTETRKAHPQIPHWPTSFTFGVLTGLVEIATVALENAGFSFSSNKAAPLLA